MSPRYQASRQRRGQLSSVIVESVQQAQFVMTAKPLRRRERRRMDQRIAEGLYDIEESGQVRVWFGPQRCSRDNLRVLAQFVAY